MTTKPSNYNVKYKFLRDGVECVAIHNLLSGALLLFDDSSSIQSLNKVLDNKPISEIDESIKAGLIENGVLINKDRDELDEIIMQYQSRRKDTNTLYLTLVPTMECNLNCPYCYEEIRKGKMNSKTVDGLVNFVIEKTTSSNKLDITWFGGEPTENFEAMVEITESIEKRIDPEIEIKHSIVTNGYSIPEGFIIFFKLRNLTNIQITIDGSDDIHNEMRPAKGGGNSYQQIIHNIVKYSNHFKVSVRSNLNRYNHAYDKNGLCDDLYKLGLNKNQIDNISIHVGNIDYKNNTTHPNRLSLREFSSLYFESNQIFQKRGFAKPPKFKRISHVCVADMHHSYVINYNGDLIKCYEVLGRPNTQEFQLGNVNNPPNCEGKKPIHWDSFVAFDNSVCRSCIALPVCLGGCPLIHYENKHPHNLNSFLRDNTCHVILPQLKKYINGRVEAALQNIDVLEVNVQANKE